MLSYALEEWAIVCDALVTGTQTLLIRGVDGPDRPFELRSKLFWLKPTFGIEQTVGVKKEPFPAAARQAGPSLAAGGVKLSHFAEVKGVYQVHKLFAALLLDDLHIWTDDVIRARFEESAGGLYVLLVRVYQSRTETILPAAEVPPADHGWVDLPRGLSTEGAMPVLGAEEFERVVSSVESILNPTARA